jgi:hypothetical protein
MDKPAVRQLCNLLTLAFCICSLAAHFVAESFNQGNSQAIIELAGNEGQLQEAHEHSEDNFILSPQNSLSFVKILISMIMISELFFFLPSVLPQLPPPKHFATA